MAEKYTTEQSRTWYNSLPTKRSSAAMVLRDGERVLMVKDDYRAYWTFPGGVVDEGESPFAAALRETFEETGIAITRDEASFLSVSYIAEQHGFLDRLHFFFFAALDSSATVITPEQGIEDYEWVPIGEVADRAGQRPGYVRLASMLEAEHQQYYFEAPIVV